MGQRWRRHRHPVSIENLTLGVETVIFFAVLLFTLTGSRAAFLDGLGSRSDLVVILLFLVLFALLHWLFRRHFLPRIERYFSVASYDERQIFFGLGQEVRRAENTEQLYLAIANRIASSFEADDVSILVGDEITGDYVRVISSSQSSDLPGPKLKLGCRAFVIKRLKTLSTPLTINKTDLDTWDRALITASPTLRHDRAREHETLRQLNTHLLVQLRIKDQMTGVLSLGLRRRQFPYNDRDKELLMSIASQLALIIENAKLANRMVAQERLNRELALAAEVQQQLLPSDPPRGESVEVAGFCQPARGVGGDYYDFIPFDNQLGIAIADVSGKGMPAALMMSTVQATLRSLSLDTGVPPKSYGQVSDMVSKLNRLLCNSTGASSYATFFYAQFDERTRRLAYVNAGHNPPLCLRANSSDDFVELSAGGLMVGAFDHCSYEQETFQMESGDLLLAFTDGLTEALNTEGEEFGEVRVKETLAASARLSVNEIRDEIIRRVKEWCFGAPHYDDLTFVVMKVF